MDFGVHLPLMDFGGHPYSWEHLSTFTRAASRLGFRAVAANDHLVFDVPWLDGPTALAAVIADSGSMTLATTVALPTVRGPIALAKTLSAIDLLSDGRLVVAVGPGSSPRDYEAVGLNFNERWPRFEESVRVLRALWRRDSTPFTGRFYSTEGITLDPHPVRPEGPPIWLGSWGSDAGLRRTARLADGWLASAYNTTPNGFAEAWDRLQQALAANGRNADAFPNTLATMWFHITEDRDEAEQILQQRVLPAVHRPAEVLRERLPVGPADAFAEKLDAFAAAGVQRVLIWPVVDEVRQIELFYEKVRPLVRAADD
jgi:alkanesulfonate monooxygenase SsuD/methylene tetrahydromethanopterin reductase-like flavin-dependent oxidoreductase (luciferase family)